MSKSIGIAIPVLVNSSEQLKHLARALDSIVAQSKLPDEIVISIEIASQEIDALLRKYQNLPLKLVKNSFLPGIANNSNNAMHHLETDYIYLLHQDDAIANPDLFQNLHRFLNKNEPNWVLLRGRIETGETGFAEFDQNTVLGFNRVGGPSCLIVKAGLKPSFDSSFSMLVDVVLFEDLYRELGSPVVFEGINVNYGDPPSRVSRNIPPESIRAEIVKVINRFDLKPSFILEVLQNSSLDLNQRTLIFKSVRSTYHWKKSVKLKLLLQFTLQRARYKVPNFMKCFNR
jgi:glycosyltransferase involved in cell wall biosynthesis